MRHLFALIAVAACLPWAAPAWADNAPGPAPVMRPLEAEAPLPPSPPALPEPATTVSATEALAPLPTEAEMRAAAEAEIQARRPKPLQPVQIPQRVEVLGDDSFLILPREAPLTTDGSISGRMFNDETETALPLAPSGAEPPPSLSDIRSDMAEVQAEFSAIRKDMAKMAADIASPATPTVTSPTAAAPATPEPSKVAMPASAKPKSPETQAPANALPPPLTLAYQADRTATPTGKLAAWAKKYAGRHNLQITTVTAALPLGANTTALAKARWKALQPTLKEAGFVSARVSFIHLLGDEGAQSLTLKAVK
ncbi:MAG: hypothetical protein H6922_04260 [Pseudomonadaceae bacterium]|nr:hypothetical protein [Pseudomonadaceae bacterium]